MNKAGALTGLRQFASAARACSDLSRRLKAEPYGWGSTNLALQRARLRISLGDLDRARQHLLVDPAEPTYKSNRAEYDAYRALIDAALSRRDAALVHAKRAERSPHGEPYGVACIARAILGIHGRPNCTANTLHYFSQALECGHLDAIVIGCRAEPELAKRIAEHGEHRDALRAILAMSRDEPIARAAGLDVPRTSRRTDALSPRELEVYELMIQGRTNQQIASNLFITESTAKVHVRHIFDKLGVRSRVEAVRAQPAPEESV